MPIIIRDLLTLEAVTHIRHILAKASFTDGRATAGVAVRQVKQNLQADPEDQRLVACGEQIINALLQNDDFRAHALPRRLMPPLFNRYDSHMQYGDHVDNAIMGGADMLRADVSITVFLSALQDYDGGELIVGSDMASQSVKLSAGSAAIYSADTLHRVEPVTRGTRYAAVTWAQSLVRDAAKRELVAELTALAQWARELAPGSKEAMKLSKIRTNLMRMWAEL